MTTNPDFSATSTVNPTPPAPPRRLFRSRQDRMLVGVCGGLARYLGVDATLVRVLLLVLTVFGVGAGALAYLIAWIVIPEEPAVASQEPPAQPNSTPWASGRSAE